MELLARGTLFEPLPLKKEAFADFYWSLVAFWQHWFLLVRGCVDLSGYPVSESSNKCIHSIDQGLPVLYMTRQLTW